MKKIQDGHLPRLPDLVWNDPFILYINKGLNSILLGQSIQNQVTLGGDPLGFSLFLDMLIHTIKELIMHNYSSVPQTVPEIWLTHISAGHKGPIS